MAAENRYTFAYYSMLNDCNADRHPMAAFGGSPLAGSEHPNYLVRRHCRARK